GRRAVSSRRTRLLHHRSCGMHIIDGLVNGPCPARDARDEQNEADGFHGHILPCQVGLLPRCKENLSVTLSRSQAKNKLWQYGFGFPLWHGRPWRAAGRFSGQKWKTWRISAGLREFA